MRREGCRSIDAFDDDNRTVLIHVCENLCLDLEKCHRGVKIISSLLEHGADPRIVDDNERSALSHFCHPLDLSNNEADADCQLEIMRLLLEKGADPNTACARQAPIRMSRIQIREVALLREYGADINQTSSSGCTALHHAAMGNDEQAVISLLDQGIDAIAKDLHDKTARYYMTGRAVKFHDFWAGSQNMIYDPELDNFIKVRV